MVLAVILGAVGVVVTLEALHKLTRAVTRHGSKERIIDLAVRPWMLRGFHGTRAIVFHQASGTMIQAIKTLTPRLSLKGKVNLLVLKTCVAQAETYNLDRAWRLNLSGPEHTACMLFWRLPSIYKVEVAEKVDCGASMNNLVQVTARMLSEAYSAVPKPVFYVWCEKGCSSYVAGQFDDF